MRFKDGGIAAMIVAAILLALCLLTGGIVFYAMLAIVLVALAADYLLLSGSSRDLSRHLVVSIDLKKECFAGMRQPLEVKLEYNGKRTYSTGISIVFSRDLTITGMTPRPTKLRRGRPAIIKLEAMPEKPGSHRVGPVTMTLGSKFFEAPVKVGAQEEIIAYLAMGGGLKKKRESHSTVRKRISGTFYRQQTRKGEGVDFSGIKEYTPGDIVHNIDWKRTAKTGRMIVREFESDRIMPAVFMVDADASMSTGSPVSELDSAVSLTASLFNSYLSENEKTGLAIFSSSGLITFIPPDIGREHTIRAKHVLSSLKPAGDGIAKKCPVTIQEAGLMAGAFKGVEGMEQLGDILDETMREYRINAKSDGFMKAVMKVCVTARDPCNIVVLTNLSMGMTSLTCGIRTARYYGHHVSVVLTPHIWYDDDDDNRSPEACLEKYHEAKETLSKVRSSGGINVIDIAAGDDPEALIYTSRLEKNGMMRR